MNKKFFAALASATMAFTASGSIAVFADDFVEESNVVTPGDLQENPTKVVFNKANFGALVEAGAVKFKKADSNEVVLEKDKEVETSKLEEIATIELQAGFEGEVRGLEYFTKLEKFDDANATAVTNEALDFSANVKLKTLSVKKASILNGIELPKADKNEDDEDVYRLETLTLNKTKLTSVDLANYSNLDSATVTENYNLKEVALPKGKASAKMVVNTLDLSHNALETINLDHYTITNLNLNGNHIGALDLSKTTATTSKLGTQKLYVSEKAANVDLDKEVEGLSLFKVESTQSKKYVQDTGEFTLNTDGTENSYVYNTGLATMKVNLAFANPMNRLYNPNSGEHFYTADLKEKEALVALGWNDEGYGWVSPTVENGKANGKPVFRLYNPNAGDHHYTVDEREARTLISYGWKDENVGWYSAGAVTVWRQYNPYANGAGSHNYTTDRAENDYLVSLGWVGEGRAWSALK